MCDCIWCILLWFIQLVLWIIDWTFIHWTIKTLLCCRLILTLILLNFTWRSLKDQLVAWTAWRKTLTMWKKRKTSTPFASWDRLTSRWNLWDWDMVMVMRYVLLHFTASIGTCIYTYNVSFSRVTRVVFVIIVMCITQSTLYGKEEHVHVFVFISIR